MSTIQDTLVNAGFEPSVAKIYTILTSAKELPVGEIIKLSGLSRAGTYDALNLLLSQGYIDYRKEGRNAFYWALHPNKLHGLIEQKKRDEALLEQEMGETIRSLIGSYNLANNKPGVRFFEGKNGIIEAYEELLKIGQPIDSIEDKGEMAKFIPEYYPQFIQKRVEKNILNRVIAPTTNQINVTSEKEKRETRTIPVDLFPFTMDIKICGNCVLLATLKQEGAIAVLIDHPLIAENFKLIFKFFWHHAAARNSSSGEAASASNISKV